jgi:serine/threonine-protein kinase RsbW
MDKTIHQRTLSVKNEIQELESISAFVATAAEEWDMDFNLEMQLNLVLEEAFTNIVKYAYSDTGSHTVTISLELNGDELAMALTDDGRFYDPTQREDPDISLPAEKREIGGLGIYLIRKMTDRVEYDRINNTNVLRIFKRIR